MICGINSSRGDQRHVGIPNSDKVLDISKAPQRRYDNLSLSSAKAKIIRAIDDFDSSIASYFIEAISNVHLD